MGDPHSYVFATEVPYGDREPYKAETNDNLEPSPVQTPHGIRASGFLNVASLQIMSGFYDAIRTVKMPT